MTTERAILTALDRVCSETTHFSLPESTLHSDVNLILAEPITLSPLRSALISLEGKRQVVSVKSEDRGTLWKITSEGRLRIAS